MPQNLVDVSQFDAAVTVPVDGDVRNAASVQTGFQNVANRTRYISNLIANGLIQAQPVASIAALTALPAPTTNALAFVPFWGLYVFDTASTAAAMSNHVIVPASAPASGRWKNAEAPYVALGGAGGTVPQWQIPIPNAMNVMPIVKQLNAGPYTVTTLGAYTDSGVASDPITCLAGDVLEVEAWGSLRNDNVNGNMVQARIVGNNGVSNIALNGVVTLQPNMNANIAGQAPFYLSEVYTAAAATYTFKIQLFIPNLAGASGSLLGPIVWKTKQYRPLRTDRRASGFRFLRAQVAPLRIATARELRAHGSGAWRARHRQRRAGDARSVRALIGGRPSGAAASSARPSAGAGPRAERASAAYVVRCLDAGVAPDRRAALRVRAADTIAHVRAPDGQWSAGDARTVRASHASARTGASLAATRCPAGRSGSTRAASALRGATCTRRADTRAEPAPGRVTRLRPGRSARTRTRDLNARDADAAAGAGRSGA